MPTRAKTTPSPASPPSPAAAKVAKPPKAAEAKPSKKPREDKPRKPKLVRDSFTMPKDEYAAIDALKARCAQGGAPAKKSELLRAGLMLLAALDDAALQAAMQQVPALKTGRPAKA